MAHIGPVLLLNTVFSNAIFSEVNILHISPHLKLVHYTDNDPSLWAVMLSMQLIVCWRSLICPVTSPSKHSPRDVCVAMDTPLCVYGLCLFKCCSVVSVCVCVILY